MIDLPQFRIEGRDADVDSFAACIHGAMKYWGREIDYHYVAGLSGVVFSPAWNKSESCAAWWTELGNNIRIGFLGTALGFQYMASPDKNGSIVEGKNINRMSEFLKTAKTAVSDGLPVLIGSWPTWSVIKEWDDNLENHRLETVKGPVEKITKPHPTSKLYILTPSNPEMSKKRAIRESIKFGEEIASGKFVKEGFEYGGSLYGEFLRKLDDEHFCPDCKGRSHNCAARTIERVRGLQLSAVEFLKIVATQYEGTVTKTSILGIASGYQFMADTLEPFNFSSLKENWGNKAHMDELKKSLVTVIKMHEGASRALGKVIGEL